LCVRLGLAGDAFVKFPLFLGVTFSQGRGGAHGNSLSMRMYTASSSCCFNCPRRCLIRAAGGQLGEHQSLRWGRVGRGGEVGWKCQLPPPLWRAASVVCWANEIIKWWR
jgi:hypothetical protein